MSVITPLSSKANSANAKGPKAPTPWAGLWLNLGVTIGDETEGKFARLNRGVAIDDLTTTRIYESTSEDYAAQASIMNQVVEQIRAKAETLAPGESMPINLEVVLYRAQEESSVKPDLQASAALEMTLFNKTG